MKRIDGIVGTSTSTEKVTSTTTGKAATLKTRVILTTSTTAEKATSTTTEKAATLKTTGTLKQTTERSPAFTWTTVAIKSTSIEGKKYYTITF